MFNIHSINMEGAIPTTLEETLRAILELAHARTKGPAEPDTLWEIRDMAGEALACMGSPTSEETARYYQQACLQARLAVHKVHELCVHAVMHSRNIVSIDAVNAAIADVPPITRRSDDPWNYADSTAVQAIENGGRSIEQLMQETFRRIGAIPVDGTGAELRYLIGQLAQAVPAVAAERTSASDEAASLRALLLQRPALNAGLAHAYLNWSAKVDAALGVLRVPANESILAQPDYSPQSLAVRIDMDAVVQTALDAPKKR